MLKWRWSIATMAALLVAPPAVAQQPGTALFGGFGQYTLFDDNLNLENGFGGGIRIGGYIAPNMWLEAEGSYTEVDSDVRLGGTFPKVKYGPISARLMWGIPFGTRVGASLGAGAVLSNYRSETAGYPNGYNYGFEGAAGLHFGLGTMANLRLQALADFMPNSKPDASTNFRFQAGIDVTPDFSSMMGLPMWDASAGPVVWWANDQPQPQPGTLEVGVFGQWTWFGESAGLVGGRPEDAFGYGGRLGVFWTPNWQIEGDGQYTNADIDGAPAAGAAFRTSRGVVFRDSDLDYSTFALRVNYNWPLAFFGGRSSFLLGAGTVRTNYGVGEDEGRAFTYNWGASGIAGLRLGVANRVALRFDGLVDYMPESVPDATTNFAVRGGLSLFLGGAARVAPAPPPPPPPAPLPPAPLPPPPPPPPPVVVAVDTTDLLAPIYFDFDKSDIRPDAAATLDRKVPWLQANPGVRLRIEGNADNRGSDEYNLALGQRRAASAKQYLVNRGIAADRFDLVSYGEERPACTQEPMTEECHQLNRRDDFVIVARPSPWVRP